PGSYSRARVFANAESINTDRSLISNPQSSCVSGSRIKLADSTAVYYCGADGRRYVFPSPPTYMSWYDDWNDVLTVSTDTMASLPLGGIVTYKPGHRLVKIQTDPRVYAVDAGGVLRWVTSEALAIQMYG